MKRTPQHRNSATPLLALALLVFASVAPAQTNNDPKQQKAFEDAWKRERDLIRKAEKEGVEVPIKNIATWRGVRPNQIRGIGLVTGLAGTGDSRKSVVTQELFANFFKDLGINLDPKQLDNKNVAAVMITAELPPFATNGQLIDISVEAIGDAKSLVGGTLMQSTLHLAGDNQTVIAVAQGQIVVGGFDVNAGGSSSSKGHVTAGGIPDGAIVERGVQTKTVFDGKMYLDLDEQDATTATRVVEKIKAHFPQLLPFAENSRRIQLSIPAEMNPVELISKIEGLTVFADTAASIVINEKTGTIVFGANVKVGPAAIAHGSLNVRIDTVFDVSQPNPLSLGSTVVTQNSQISTDEQDAKITTLPPNTTVQDLARIFQALNLKPKDIIAILKALKEQGALKARIITQ